MDCSRSSKRETAKKRESWERKILSSVCFDDFLIIFDLTLSCAQRIRFGVCALDSVVVSLQHCDAAFEQSISLLDVLPVPEGKRISIQSQPWNEEAHSVRRES